MSKNWELLSFLWFYIRFIWLKTKKTKNGINYGNKILQFMGIFLINVYFNCILCETYFMCI